MYLHGCSGQLALGLVRNVRFRESECESDVSSLLKRGTGEDACPTLENFRFARSVGLERKKTPIGAMESFVASHAVRRGMGERRRGVSYANDPNEREEHPTIKVHQRRFSGNRPVTVIVRARSE